MALGSRSRIRWALVGAAALVALGSTPAFAAKPALTVGDAGGSEADGNLFFEVTLSKKPKRAVTVNYATVSGTATEGEDYEAASGKLRFKKKVKLNLVAVALSDDPFNEADDEQMTLQLSSPKRAKIADGEGTGLITDDDAPNLVDFCAIQFPDSASLPPSSTFQVYARVYEPGLTDESAANDLSITSGVGLGPDGSDPATDPGWTWFSSAPNPAYNVGAPGFDLNLDEHQGSITAPAALGSYDYAYRFSLDGGLSYGYCGATTGPAYTPADAGALTINP